MERVTQNNQLLCAFPFFYSNNGESALVTSPREITNKILLMPLPVAARSLSAFFDPAQPQPMEIRRRIPGNYYKTATTHERHPLAYFPPDAIEITASLPTLDLVVTDEDDTFIYVRPKTKEDIPVRTFKRPLSALKTRIHPYQNKQARREPIECVEVLHELEHDLATVRQRLHNAPFHDLSDLTETHDLLRDTDITLHTLLVYYHQQHAALEAIKKEITLRPFHEDDRALVNAFCHTIYDGRLRIPPEIPARARQKLREEHARFYHELHAEFPSYILGFYHQHLFSAVSFPREKTTYINPVTKEEEIFDGFIMQTINLDPPLMATLFPTNPSYGAYVTADIMTAYAQQAGAHGVVIRDHAQEYPAYFSRRGFTHKTRREKDPLGKQHTINYYLKEFTLALQSSPAGADRPPVSDRALISYAV